MSTFDVVSGECKQKSLVQATAAEKLIARIKICGKEDVLDAVLEILHNIYVR